MTYLLTAAEMRALDRHAIDSVGIPGAVLMETAGRGVAEVVRQVGGGAATLVFAGPGNNGGDGFVVARWLHGWGVAVEVLLCAQPDKIRGEARVHFDAAHAAGVRVQVVADEAALEAAVAASAAPVVVDALLGTGLERPLAGLMAAAVRAINERGGLKVAVDIPSGLDSDRGVALGGCVRADHTVTLAFAKRGLAVAPGFTFAGQLHVVDIGIPEAWARERDVKARLLDEGVLAPVRAPLGPLGHKGTHGHVLLVAGSPGKTGAAALSGRAALRAGAGLVTVATPRDTVAALASTPELMSAPYGPAAGAWDSDAAAAELVALLGGKQALAVGPGMPHDAGVRPVLARLVAEAARAGVPMVLDADALNHLAAAPEILDGARAASAPRVVLTPHPGEAARLLGRSTADVQADRLGAAAELALRWGAVVALKGARTIVAAPDGALAVCPTGNAGLGTAGTGDVLTGCVAALLVGLPPFDAACAAVYLHGAAGDAAATSRGQRGLIASDVIDALPALLR